MIAENAPHLEISIQISIHVSPKIAFLPIFSNDDQESREIKWFSKENKACFSNFTKSTFFRVAIISFDDINSFRTPRIGESVFFVSETK